MNGALIASYTHFLNTKLRPGETPLLFLEGALSGEAMAGGCFILTDRRACFCRKTLVGEDFKALQLASVHALQMNSHWSGRTLALAGAEGELRFVTLESQDLFDLVYRRVQTLMGGAKAPVASPPVDKVDRLQAQIKEARVRRSAPPAKPPETAADEDEEPSGLAALEALERLAKLRDAGVVTEAEFQTKKADLLSRV